MFDTMKAEPIIGVAARIAPFDHGGAGIIMETLPDHADALDLFGGDRREIDIDQRPLGERRVEQWRDHFGTPCLGSGERHGVGHAFAGIDLAERDRAHPCQRALDGGALALLDADDGAQPGMLGGNTDGEASLYDQAVALVTREGKASTSFVQRHLNIGYNRAAKLIEQMEKEGVVGAANHVGKREVLAPGPRD